MENFLTSLPLVAYFILFAIALQFRERKLKKYFDNWHETYYLVVEFIITERNKLKPSGEVAEMQKSFGTSGMFSLARVWAEEFEELHKNELWEELDFYDEVERFCKEKNKI